MIRSAAARRLPEWSMQPANDELESPARRGADTEPAPATRNAWVAFWLALLAVLPFLNALGAGFTLDDEPDILNNPAVTGGVDLVGVLTSSLFGILYRPLTVLTFALNHALSPGNATPFHAVNILLHAIVTLLVFMLGLRLFDSARIAALAGALFAVHPVHTEAVTSIVGRAEILGAAFGLLALLSAERADRAERAGSRRALQGLSVISFALALLSKESALTVVPLIVLFRVTCRGEPLWRGLWTELRSLDWVPYVLCAGVFAVLRSQVIQIAPEPYRLTPLDNVLAFVPWSVRWRSALGVLWDYFGLLNVPLMLAADYSYDQVPIIRSWLSPRCVGGLALVVGTLLVFVRQRRPAVAFAALIPLATMVVTANLVFPIGTVKAERLLYFPSVGWALIVAYGFERLARVPRYRPVAVGLLAMVMLVFSARTWTRNGDWTNNLTLYRSMAHTAPDSAKARYNFGVALQQEGADAAALAQFQRALDIYRWTAGAALGIAVIFEKRGHIDTAVLWYRKALEIEPGFEKAHTNLCHVLYSNGRFDAAMAACRSGLRYNPTDANLLKGLGASLVGAGATDKGIEVLRRSLALNQHDEELRAYIAQLETVAAANGGERVVRR
jgi:Tfp pilus assembly protein PilF